MVYTLNELVGELLTNLQTCVVSGFLLVVTCVDTFVDTLDELVDVYGINNLSLLYSLTDILRLYETNGVAHGVYIVLHVCLGCRVAARSERCGCNSQRGYKCKFFHLVYLFCCFLLFC